MKKRSRTLSDMTNLPQTEPKKHTKLIHKCKRLIDFRSRKIAFLYTNPRLSQKFQQVTGLQTLNALTREMRYVISLLNPFDFIIQPATTLENFTQTLTKYSPVIVFWSGHTVPLDDGKLLFENNIGNIDMVEPKSLADILIKQNQLKILILMGCNTDKIAEIISKTMSIHVICWSTVTEDDAAAAFTSGMIHYIQDMLYKNSKITENTAKEIFAKGLSEFKKEYKEGDPQEEIQKNRENPDPNFIPKTHGKPVLIKNGKHQYPVEIV